MKTEEILKLKELTPNQKLLMIAISIDYTEIWNLGNTATAGELGKAIGISRKKALDLIWELEELNFITTEVDGNSRSRKTSITNEFKRLLKGNKKETQLIIN